MQVVQIYNYFQDLQKGMREEMGNDESNEGGGNLEHFEFSMELTVTKAKKVSPLGGW